MRVPIFLLIAALSCPPALAEAASPLAVTGSVAAPAMATVTLLPLPSDHAWRRGLLAGRTTPEAAVMVEAGQDGRFVVAVPAAAIWSVVATAPGHVPMRYFPLPVTRHVELPPIALAPDAGLEAMVRSAQGQPVADAWVMAETAAPELWREHARNGWRVGARLGRTDAAGRLLLPRLAGEMLRVHAFVGGARASAEVAAEAMRVELIVSPPPGERLLELRDPAGTPLAEVVASIGEPAWPAGVTDGDGRLRLALAATDALDLRFPDGFRHSIANFPGTGEPLRIEVPAPARFAGRVLDAPTRKPLVGALVWPGDDPGHFTFTQTDGTYTLTARADDRSWLQAESHGHLPRAERLRRAEDGRMPTLALESAGSAEGRVVDAAGAPLGGVVVTAVATDRQRPEAFHPDSVTSRAVSRADGGFRLGALHPAASYELGASRAGYRTRRSTLVGGEQRGLRLVLERARAAHGRVVDGHERPIEGAEVTIRPTGGRGDLESETVTSSSGADGRFELEALPGERIDLGARRQGFAPRTVPGVVIVPGPGAADLGTLILETGARIEGRVSGAEGRPLAGAEVRVGEADRQPDGTLATALRREPPAAVSGADGRFVVADLVAARAVHVLLTHEGHLPAWVPGVEPPTAEPLEVVLEPAARIRGTVEDPTGGPVPAAQLRLRALSPPPGTVGVELPRGGNTRDLRAEGDGSFTIVEVAPGKVTLEAWAEGFVPHEPVELEIPATGGLDGVRLVLDHGATVAGRVSTTEGEPVAGARLRIGPSQGASDAEGLYRLSGVALGVRGLVLTHPEWERQIREVDVQPGLNKVDLTVSGGQTVSGRVIDEAGAPTAGARVELARRSDRDPRRYSAMSGADGGFRFAAVAEGRYDLTAEAEGFAPTLLADRLEVAGEAVGGLELVLRRGTTVAGRLLGLDLDELAAVEVAAEHAGRAARAGRVDYAGRYEITHLEPGDWWLRARLAGGRRQAEARVVVASGEPRVERDLEFSSGLVLTGQVLYEGRPLASTHVDLRGLEIAAVRSVATDHQGSFRIEDLDPGRYRIDLANPQQLLTHTEDLELRGDREMVFELATAALTGRVVAAETGEPVAEALVYVQRLLGTGEPGPLTTVGTDATGAFTLARLAAARYRLTLRADGYAPAERRVEVVAGVPAEPLTIELEPSGGLALMILRATGEPPQMATVVVLDGFLQPIHADVRQVSGQGHVYFPQAPPGAWTVLVKAEGTAAVSLRVSVPGERRTVTLPPAASLAVRVPALLDSRTLATLTIVSAEGNPFVSVAPGGALESSWPVSGGTATVADVPAGTWRLEVAAGEGRVWSRTVVTAGEPATVSLE